MAAVVAESIAFHRDTNVRKLNVALQTAESLVSHQNQLQQKRISQVTEKLRNIKYYEELNKQAKESINKEKDEEAEYRHKRILISQEQQKQILAKQLELREKRKAFFNETHDNTKMFQVYLEEQRKKYETRINNSKSLEANWATKLSSKIDANRQQLRQSLEDEIEAKAFEESKRHLWKANDEIKMLETKKQEEIRQKALEVTIHELQQNSTEAQRQESLIKALSEEDARFEKRKEQHAAHTSKIKTNLVKQREMHIAKLKSDAVSKLNEDLQLLRLGEISEANLLQKEKEEKIAEFERIKLLQQEQKSQMRNRENVRCAKQRSAIASAHRQFLTLAKFKEDYLSYAAKIRKQAQMKGLHLTPIDNAKKHALKGDLLYLNHF